MHIVLLKFFTIVSRILPSPFKKLVYQLGPPTSWIRRFLNMVSPDGLTRVSISAGGPKALQMELDLQSEKDYWLGTYEIELQHMLKHIVQRGWIVYDIGANIGYFSLFLASLVGEKGHIFSFETLPENVLRLRKNISMNHLDARVTIVQKAVVDTTRPVQFLLGPSGSMGKALGSAGREDIHTESIDVSGTCLDDFIYQEGYPIPKVIKMDIEGGEILALKGMRRLLQEKKPIIFLELHGKEAAKASWEIFQESGYKLRRMEKSMPFIHSLAELSWKAYVVATP